MLPIGSRPYQRRTLGRRIFDWLGSKNSGRRQEAKRKEERPKIGAQTAAKRRPIRTNRLTQPPIKRRARPTGVGLFGIRVREPCVPSEPPVRSAARRANGAAEEDRHRLKLRAPNVRSFRHCRPPGSAHCWRWPCSKPNSRLSPSSIQRRRELGSTAKAAHDHQFLAALYKTLQAWGIGARASKLRSYNDFESALRAKNSKMIALEEKLSRISK